MSAQVLPSPSYPASQMHFAPALSSMHLAFLEHFRSLQVGAGCSVVELLELTSCVAVEELDASAVVEDASRVELLDAAVVDGFSVLLEAVVAAWVDVELTPTVELAVAAVVEGFSVLLEAVAVAPVLVASVELASSGFPPSFRVTDKHRKKYTTKMKFLNILMISDL